MPFAWIEKLRGAREIDDKHPPVLELEEYFEGNEEEESIAPNQVGFGRPPLKVLYERFLNIRSRSDVQTVLVGIHDDWIESLEADDLWPPGDHVYIYTSAGHAEVENWIDGLAADGALNGWPKGKHKLAPDPLPGFQVYAVVWD